MKLSKREMIMLILLIIIAVVFLESRFVINPGLEKWNQLSEEKIDTSMQVDQVRIKIDTLEVLEKNLQDMIVKINQDAKPYFDGINPDIMLNYTRDMIMRNGLIIAILTPVDINIIPVEVPDAQLHDDLYRLKELAAQYNGTETDETIESDPASAPTPTPPMTPEDAADKIEQYKVVLSLTGYYEQLRTLLVDVAAQNRSIRVNDLSIQESLAPGMLDFNLTLEFYGLTKLEKDPTDTLNSWPRAPYDGGSNNPYPTTLPSANETDPTSGETTETSETTNG